MRNLLRAFAFVAAFLPNVVFAQSGGTTTRPTWFDGAVQYYVSTAHPLPVSTSVSASVSGFHEESVLTPITATTGGVNSPSFTAGKVVVATNAGSTNIAYCQLGASATTSAQPIAPNGGWFAFTSTSETQITCATSTSTTTVNFAVGTGLPTGTGGGSGGGGSSGAVFGPTAVGSAAANPPVLTGGTADGTATGAVAVSTIKAGNTAAVGDKAVVVADPNVLAAINAPIPSQSPAVPIGGTGICDGANGATNPCTTVATVKAASTPAAATDKALVVDQRPGGNTAASVAPLKGSVPVVNGGSTYQAVAASQTATVLGATGAAGDYLSHCDIYPTSTTPGVVTVFDNANAAATNVIAFPGGASSVSNLVPFAVPVGAVSAAGAWKVTTGANVSVVCYGKFT